MLQWSDPYAAPRECFSIKGFWLCFLIERGKSCQQLLSGKGHISRLLQGSSAAWCHTLSTSRMGCAWLCIAFAATGVKVVEVTLQGTGAYEKQLSSSIICFVVILWHEKMESIPKGSRAVGGTPEIHLVGSTWSWCSTSQDVHRVTQLWLDLQELVQASLCNWKSDKISSRTSSNMVKVKGNGGGGCGGGGRWERRGHHFLVPGKGFTKAVFYFFNADVGGEEGLEKEAWG